MEQKEESLSEDGPDLGAVSVRRTFDHPRTLPPAWCTEPQSPLCAEDSEPSARLGTNEGATGGGSGGERDPTSAEEGYEFPLVHRRETRT